MTADAVWRLVGKVHSFNHAVCCWLCWVDVAHCNTPILQRRPLKAGIEEESVLPGHRF